MIIGLTSDSTSLRDLRTLADWTIRPRLLSIGGVAQVTVIGGEMKEYQILLDLPRMKQYGVTLDEVLNAAREMNRNANGGICMNMAMNTLYGELSLRPTSMRLPKPW